MKKPKKLSASLVAVTLCLASVSATLAQTQTETQTTTSAPNQTVTEQTTPPATTTTTTTTTTPSSTCTTPPQAVSKCSQLIGTKVVNQQGEDLGKITDVVVSYNNNQVSYCIMRVNRHGFFARTKYVAV